MKIIPPEGYEIDKENSTFECIKFKKKLLTYENIVKELFKDKYYYIDSSGDILDCYDDDKNSVGSYDDKTTSKKQLEKLIAINKLINVSKYLNGDWKPNWSDERDHKFYIGIEGKEIYVNDTDTNNESVCYFKCPALAQQAIDILGKDTIYLAFSTDW